MRDQILKFPEQFIADFPEIKKIKKNKDLKLITICGMGGSALAGDLLKIVANFPIIIHRDYALPSQTSLPLTLDNKNAMIICISYSGNTEETLSSYQEAIKNNFFTISLSSGGKLFELSSQNKNPHIKIPAGLPPRSAVGYIINALIKILEKQGIIINYGSRPAGAGRGSPRQDGAAKNLKNLSTNIKPEKLEGIGQQLAKKLIGNIPLIYSSAKYAPLAYNLKIKFNENSKIPAFVNFFPELNHNEMLSFQPISQTTNNIHFQALAISKNLSILILKDKDEPENILKRIMLTADLIKKNGFEVEFINIEGNNDLEKIFNTSILGDWMSYYLAKEYEIDPIKTEIIEEFKKNLN